MHEVRGAPWPGMEADQSLWIRNISLLPIPLYDGKIAPETE